MKESFFNYYIFVIVLFLFKESHYPACRHYHINYKAKTFGIEQTVTFCAQQSADESTRKATSPTYRSLHFVITATRPINKINNIGNNPKGLHYRQILEFILKDTHHVQDYWRTVNFKHSSQKPLVAPTVSCAPRPPK